MAEQEKKANVALHGAGNCPCEVRGEKGRKEGRETQPCLGSTTGCRCLRLLTCTSSTMLHCMKRNLTHIVTLHVAHCTFHYSTG